MPYKCSKCGYYWPWNTSKHACPGCNELSTLQHCAKEVQTRRGVGRPKTPEGWVCPYCHGKGKKLYFRKVCKECYENLTSLGINTPSCIPPVLPKDSKKADYRCADCETLIPKIYEKCPLCYPELAPTLPIGIRYVKIRGKLERICEICESSLKTDEIYCHICGKVVNSVDTQDVMVTSDLFDPEEEEPLELEDLQDENGEIPETCDTPVMTERKVTEDLTHENGNIGSMRTISVNVPRRSIGDLEQLVSRGDYANRSEAIRAAIRDLVRRELYNDWNKEAK